jgi:DNA-binding GntR family transcriptional regulator
VFLVFDSTNTKDEIETVTDRIFEVLKQKILSGEYIPGSRLKHVDLANELHVSPTPIREALTRLEKVRLVEYAPRKGWFVHVIASAEAQMLYEVREYLEGLSARRLADNFHPAKITPLEAEIQKFEDCFNKGDINGCVDSDMTFHIELAIQSGNSLAIEMMKALFDRIYVLRRLDIELESLRYTMVEHLQILDAIKSGNGDEAELAARRHVKECQKIIPQLLVEQNSDKHHQ